LGSRKVATNRCLLTCLVTAQLYKEEIKAHALFL
jgi:hypothetical protein